MPNPKGNNLHRKPGTDATLKMVVEANSLSLGFKALDAMGGFASMDHVEWEAGNSRVAKQQATNAIMKAELAAVEHVESWNRDLAAFKARQWLVSSVARSVPRPTAAAARAAAKATDRLTTTSLTSSKRRRLEAATNLNYKDYRTRVYPIVKAVQELTTERMDLFDEQPLVVGTEYNLTG